MATSLPANPTLHTVTQLLGKLTDNDPDFRFMALNDLISVFGTGKHDMLYHDYNTAARTIDHVVKALDDQNGEVQNQAIKWSVPCSRRACPCPLAPLTLLHHHQSRTSSRQNPKQSHCSAHREGHDPKAPTFGRQLGSCTSATKCYRSTPTTAARRASDQGRC